MWQEATKQSSFFIILLLISTALKVNCKVTFNLKVLTSRASNLEVLRTLVISSSRIVLFYCGIVYMFINWLINQFVFNKQIQTVDH